MPTKRKPAKPNNADKFVESVKELMEPPYNISRQMLRETNIEEEPVIQPGEQTATPRPKRFLHRSTVDRMLENGIARLNIERDVVRVLRKLLPDLAWDDSVDVCVRWLKGGEIPGPLDKEGPIRKMRKELEVRIEGAREPASVLNGDC